MSFMATDPDTTPSAPSEGSTILNDGFFPDIDINQLRQVMRLDGTVTPERLRDAAVTAILTVNSELDAWKALQQQGGVDQLADMPPQIDGKSAQESRYFTAVYRLAQADLAERYRDFDATRSGVDEADKLEATIDGHRAAAKTAIRAILGVPRATVELI